MQRPGVKQEQAGVEVPSVAPFVALATVVGTTLDPRGSSRAPTLPCPLQGHPQKLRMSTLALSRITDGMEQQATGAKDSQDTCRLALGPRLSPAHQTWIDSFHPLCLI